jgi:molecular chaperone GrpE (heat shock protein)
MKTLFESIEKEISESLSRVTSIDLNGGILEKLENYKKKISCFHDELLRLNEIIPNLSNEYGRKNDVSKEDIVVMKEFIDNSMSDFLKKSGVPGVNSNYKFDTKLL